jgi:hypothetical protein
MVGVVVVVVVVVVVETSLCVARGNPLFVISWLRQMLYTFVAKFRLMDEIDGMGLYDLICVSQSPSPCLRAVELPHRAAVSVTRAHVEYRNGGCLQAVG